MPTILRQATFPTRLATFPASPEGFFAWLAVSVAAVGSAHRMSLPPYKRETQVKPLEMLSLVLQTETRTNSLISMVGAQGLEPWTRWA